MTRSFAACIIEVLKGKKRNKPFVNSTLEKWNTCRQNRREAVTQSQGTLLQTTCRLAEDRGKRTIVWLKSTPGCNIVSLRILGCNLFLFRKSLITALNPSGWAKKTNKQAVSLLKHEKFYGGRQK